MGDFIEKDGNVSREQVWLAAWLAVAGAANCTRPRYPVEWADDCLAEFDKRFPASKASQPEAREHE